jgi:hypothetical protein
MNCYRTDLTFLRLLRECYFHPSRDAAFPSPEMKHVIFLFGKSYGRKQIRRTMILRMMPEHLDEAVNFFVLSQELTTVDHLAELIFACVIHGDTLTDIQFERDFGGAA